MFRRFTFLGDYSGTQSAGLAFRFRFCSDGTYFYTVEQTGRWRFAHRGRYEADQVPDPGRAHKYLTVVRFEPEFIDVPIPDRDEHIRETLDERALLADRLEEYLVSESSSPDSWRPDRQRRRYNFSRPNPQDRLYPTSWTLQRDE